MGSNIGGENVFHRSDRCGHAQIFVSSAWWGVCGVSLNRKYSQGYSYDSLIATWSTLTRNGTRSLSGSTCQSSTSGVELLAEQWRYRNTCPPLPTETYILWLRVWAIVPMNGEKEIVGSCFTRWISARCSFLIHMKIIQIPAKMQ